MTEREEGASPPAAISGIILAAGTATRLGRPKQLLPLGDRPLLQHVVDAAAKAELDEIIVVLGHAADPIRRELRLPGHGRIRMNPRFAAGQASSLAAGLRAASSRVEAAVVLLGDQPGISPRAIDAAVRLHARTGARIVRAVYGKAPGHPVVLDRSVWARAAALRGDEGARTLMEAHPEWVLPLALAPPPPRDVDTWEDYRALRPR